MSEGKLVALYKAHSGGEWFGASLRSVASVVDGVVVVFSEKPWVTALAIGENCHAPLEHFRAQHPEMPVHELTIRCVNQAHQYEAGLEAVRMAFGEDAKVLIVDTDEVWEGDELARLRDEMMQRPDGAVFRAGIWTYLKSPLYQVWPQEAARVVVGLGNAKSRPVRGRFNFNPGSCRLFDVAAVFHHFPYVRESECALRAKLLNTGSQEHVPSDYGWFERVYDRLPLGRDLHMSLGYEHVWHEIKVLPALPKAVRDSSFAQAKVRETEQEWRRWLQTAPPDETIYPTPTAADLEKYRGEMLATFGANADALAKRLKCTVLEALVLAGFASCMRPGGSIIEIGSGHGGSTACLALGFPGGPMKARICAVDPFLPYDEQTHAGTVHGVHEGDEKAFRETASMFGYNDVRNLLHLRMKSDDAAVELPDGFYDLIFVDGNHSYKVVKSDLELYWQKLRPGGILLGHDYTTRFPGVIRAADEWADGTKLELATPPGTSLFYAVKNGD